MSIFIYIFIYSTLPFKKNLGGGKILKEVFDLITNTVKNIVLWNEYI